MIKTIVFVFYKTYKHFNKLVQRFSNLLCPRHIKGQDRIPKHSCIRICAKYDRNSSWERPRSLPPFFILSSQEHVKIISLENGTVYQVSLHHMIKSEGVVHADPLKSLPPSSVNLQPGSSPPYLTSADLNVFCVRPQLKYSLMCLSIDILLSDISNKYT